MESLNFWVQVLTSIASSTLVAGIIVYVAKNFIIPVLIEKVRQGFEKEVESLRHEFSFAKSTYDQYLKIVLEYYNNIYKFYRICQKAAQSSVTVFPNGTVKSTKEEYFNNLDSFVDEYSKNEGFIRLLLPEKLMKSDGEFKNALNNFRDKIKKFNPDKEICLIECFKTLDEKTHQLEVGLREFLRTEKLLK